MTRLEANPLSAKLDYPSLVGSSGQLLCALWGDCWNTVACAKCLLTILVLLAHSHSTATLLSSGSLNSALLLIALYINAV